jgi:hypothetical protein
MRTQQDKAQMLDTLRELLRDAFRLRREGGPYARLARAHGYIDGYIRVLLDAKVVDQAELLAIVGEERRRVDGPATAAIDVLGTVRASA